MEATKQSKWFFATPSSSWTGQDEFYPLQEQATPKMKNDCGCNSPFKNDAGSNFATASAADLLKKREDYLAETTAKCKSEHPVASKISGAGRKPYTNCVNDRMANYDKTVEDTIKFERKQAADAPFNEAVASLSGGSTTTPGTIASSASQGSDMVIYGGVAILVLVLFFFGFTWYKNHQAEQAQTV